MAKLAKCYVLGEPFQSHQASKRMTAAINRYVNELAGALEGCRNAMRADNPADGWKEILERADAVLDKLAAEQPTLFPVRR